MDEGKENKPAVSENPYISKHLAPLIEKGVITDVREGEDSKILFDLSKKIKRLTVSCLLEPSYKGDFIVFKLWNKSKSGEEASPLCCDVVTLPSPDDVYHKVVGMAIKDVVREFKKALTEQNAEEEKTFPIMKIG